tara:strand:+ start:2859 stop:3080 length:222 start_codon:yes stop_codon:yes gene_type:complete
VPKFHKIQKFHKNREKNPPNGKIPQNGKIPKFGLRFQNREMNSKIWKNSKKWNAKNPHIVYFLKISPTYMVDI